MNNDLISRSEAIAAVERREPLLVGDKLVSTDSFKNFLRNRPAVDAEPVRHGRWIRQDDTFTRYMCSECESRNHADRTNYCPNCGAKMDGETNGKSD